MKAAHTLKNLRTKDAAALSLELKELQKAHFALRMQKATQQLSNTSLLGQARKDVARAKTLLKQQTVAQ